MQACSTGHWRLFENEIAEGTQESIIAQDGAGNTALHCVCSTEKFTSQPEHVSDVDYVLRLLNAGADVHGRNEDGMTPLMLVSKSGTCVRSRRGDYSM
jgi:ankyrin repeat protein